MKFKQIFTIILIISFLSIGVILYNNYEKEDTTVINSGIVLDEEVDKTTFVSEQKIIKPTYSDLKRSNTAGAINFDITFMNPKKNNEEFWVFQVVMNTHSVDLDAIPFEELVYFEDDYGNVIDQNITYIQEGSGHHISQYIKLPKKIEGNNTILKDQKDFKLVMENIEKVPQIIFSWNMTSYPEIFDH